MEIAITITAAPSREDLLLDAAAALQRDLNGALEFRWLAQGEAIDLILPAPESPPDAPSGADLGRAEIAHIKEMTAEAVGERPLDWCVQRAAGRKKNMLAADMDSTIIGQETLDEMAELRGVRAQVAAITERAIRGEADFEASLRERIGLLKGLRAADVEHLLHDRITLNPGARTLVETMKANGAHTVLVSGSFSIITHTVAARAGFAKEHSNVLLWESGHLAGIAAPVLGREEKLAAVKKEATEHGIPAAGVISVGDGASDIDMLRWAGLGVAYRAARAVTAADARVNHTGLASLLYFQGYTRSAFAG